MIVDANGIRFNCAISGREGAPWLTFSNALATELTMWDEQARAFAADYRILRYDTRGHGGSTAADGPYSLDMLGRRRCRDLGCDRGRPEPRRRPIHRLR